jgi:hypothetical protein
LIRFAVAPQKPIVIRVERDIGWCVTFGSVEEGTVSAATAGAPSRRPEQVGRSTARRRLRKTFASAIGVGRGSQTKKNGPGFLIAQEQHKKIRGLPPAEVLHAADFYRQT